MNRETIEQSRKELEKRIEEYIIGECRLFYAIHYKTVGQVSADIRLSNSEVDSTDVTVELDGKR